MKGSLLTLMAFVMCVLPLAARADWDPCCPDPDTKFVQLPDPTGWDVNLVTPKVLADDFWCLETGYITDVHFWGSWRDDLVGEITRIHLSFHSDIPAGQPDPTGLILNYSVPGEELWAIDIDPSLVPAGAVVIRDYGTAAQGWYDPNTGDYCRNNHFTMWQVNIFLDQILPLEELFVQKGSLDNPVVYWLDLQVDVKPILSDEEVAFGWKTSYEHWGPDDAVWADWPLGTAPPQGDQWSELWDPIFEDESLDMAFVLTGVPIPEPGIVTIALLGTAGLLGLRRRKHI
jgi:hypothetical protein